MRRLVFNGFVIAALCISVPQMSMAAQPSPVLTTELALRPAARDVALALFAKYCGLRSDEWVLVFTQSMTMLAQSEAEKAHLSDDDRNLVDADMQRTIHETMPPMSKCPDMVNSPTMDRLDQLENRLTGGYH